MPKSTFTGVRLQLIGDMSVTVQYPDVVSMETFLKMKAAVDATTQPALEAESQTRSNGNGKGNS